MNSVSFNNLNLEYKENGNPNPAIENSVCNNLRLKHKGVFTYQKNDDVIDNEDVFKRLDGPDKNIYVLCDGASESFAAKEWAKIVAENFIEHQDLSDKWIRDIIAKYNKKYDYNSLSWSKQSSFMRGSFCTLLACTHIYGESYISLTAIGDSTAFKILKNKEKYKIIDSFPYKNPEKYRCRPILLSTIYDDNIFMQDSSIYKFKENIEISKNDIIVLASDALSEWIMKNDESPELAKLLEIEYFGEFKELIDAQRLNQSMKTDDTTFFKITFEG